MSSQFFYSAAGVLIIAACWALSGFGQSFTAYIDTVENRDFRTARQLRWVYRFAGGAVIALAMAAGLCLGWAS